MNMRMMMLKNRLISGTMSTFYGLSARAIAGKAPRHRRHLWQRRQCGICNLQNLKEAQEFESHSLRQLLTFRFNNLQATQDPVQRSFAAAFACDENRCSDREIHRSTVSSFCFFHEPVGAPGSWRGRVARRPRRGARVQVEIGGHALLRVADERIVRER